MKTNLAEESPARRKRLENPKAQLAIPRETTLTGVFYFKVHLAKQISSSLGSGVAAAPRTLPRLTATPPRCPGTSRHRPNSQRPQPMGPVKLPPPKDFTARPAPVRQPTALPAALTAFSPPVSPFQPELLCGWRRARRLRCAKRLPVTCGMAAVRFLNGENTFPCSQERHRCRDGQDLPPQSPFPTTARRLELEAEEPVLPTTQKTAPSTPAISKTDFWKPLNKPAGILHGETRSD